MPTEFTLPENVYDHIAEELLSKTWDDVDVLTQQETERLLFPGELRQRKSDGTFKTKPIRIQVPRAPELRKARLQAREWAANEKLDPKLDAAQIRDMENTCILWFAIRNPDGPMHEPMYMDPQELERTWDKTALVQVWRKLDAYTRLTDPSPDDISKEEMLAVVAKIASERHLGPLVVYGSSAQTSCIVGMASLLVTFLDPPSSDGSSERSTPGS